VQSQDVSPAEAGMDAGKLALLRAAIEQDVENGVSDGSIILVARRGRIVMHEAIGYADRAASRAARTDDVLPVMSLTKQYTAAALFRFIDRGQVSLVSRIAEIIPEFGQGGKERVTIRDVLTHQAGLPMQHPVEDWREGNEAYVAKICGLPYDPAPDGVVNYHAGAAHAVLGEVMRRLDGGRRSLTQIFAEELFDPTGMSDTALTLSGREDLAARVAPVAMRVSAESTIPARDIAQIAKIAASVEFPAGGASSTAYDQFRLAEMLRRGGTLDGENVLSPAIIRLAMTNQTGDKVSGLHVAGAGQHNADVFPANIGLTFYVRGEGIFLASMGILNSPGTFGGYGFGGQFFWVDPERELVFVHLVVGYPQLYEGRRRSQRLSDLVVSAVLD
jgi:CubicO group peptidase (beta-lactamase class C family)